jgi:putative ABC transport system substrate-binding protein
MKRVGLSLAGFAMAVGILVMPGTLPAQTPAKLWRIGVLANSLDTSDGPAFEAFLDALARLGYVPERNIVIEWRSSEGNSHQLPALAADLVRSKVDVIVAMSLQPARAAEKATRSIPVVFVVAADPVAQGLVADPARPGANVTGLATFHPSESGQKVLELLKEATPRAARVAVMSNPNNPVHRELLTNVLPSAARPLNVTLLPLPLRSASDVDAAFDRAMRERVDAGYVLGDVFSYIHRARIVELAAKNRLPVIYTLRSAVESGGLMSYGPPMRDLFRRAATYVDRILKGARPGDLPVERSPTYELVINLKTARALGLTVPPAVMQQAAQVIE